MDFRNHSLAELAAMLGKGEVSARELITAALDRIERLDPVYNAFVAVDGEQALAEADAIDRRRARVEPMPRLAGIPLAVKDLEDAAGFPTRYGSVLSSEEPAEGDSVLVARLRRAGCVVIGKTTTPEYGHKGVTESPLSGTTANPWNLERSPGGSSGGSAAAIAAGMVPLATGSDGGGSIRIPSALCGLSGIKTSQGRVPNGGPNPPGSGLLSVKGPMARRIQDVTLALDHCMGPDPTDPFSLPWSGKGWSSDLAEIRPLQRVGWSPTMGFATVDAEVAAICRSAVDRLTEWGTDVVTIDTVWAEDPVGPWLTMWTASRARSQGHLLGTPDFEKIDSSLQQQIEWGMGVSAVDYAKAVDAIHHLNLDLEAAFEQASILLTPVCAGQAPTLGRDGTINGDEVPGWVSFTYGLNMTRNPAGTVNVGFTDDGMPVGLQVIGRPHNDYAVLRTIRMLEERFGTDRVAPVD
ncbi:MAG: amidase family protein [Actinomycetota bacterium]